MFRLYVGCYVFVIILLLHPFLVFPSFPLYPFPLFSRVHKISKV
jgi:hypothetical protein